MLLATKLPAHRVVTHQNIRDTQYAWGSWGMPTTPEIVLDVEQNFHSEPRCAYLLPQHQPVATLSASPRHRRAVRKTQSWCPQHGAGGGIFVAASLTAAIIAAHAQHRTLVCRVFPLVGALLCVHEQPLCSGRCWTAVRWFWPTAPGHCEPTTAGACYQLAVGYNRSLRSGPTTCAGGVTEPHKPLPALEALLWISICVPLNSQHYN